MKQINISIPKDVLRSLLEDKQSNYPFNTDELGFPLRITLYAAEPQKPRKFKPTRKEPG